MAIIGNIPYFQTNPYTHFLHVIVLMLHSNCRSKKPCSSKLVGGFTPLKHIAVYTDVYSHYNELAEYIFWTTDQVSLVVHPNMFSTVWVKGTLACLQQNLRAVRGCLMMKREGSQGCDLWHRTWQNQALRHGWSDFLRIVHMESYGNFFNMFIDIIN